MSQSRLVWMGLLLFGLQGCGTQWQNAALTTPQHKPIINGEKCSSEQFPSALAVIAEAEIDYGAGGRERILEFICGGTLIAPDIVVTAAHCIDLSDLGDGHGHVAWANYYVTSQADLAYLSDAGKAKIPAGAILAKKFVSHEKYDKTDASIESGLGNDKDIGLLFLSRKMSIEPATTISREEAKQLRVGQEAWIVGWGQTAPEEIEARIHSTKMMARSTINEIGDFEMQIGSDAKSSRKCFGDSGGPTYVMIKTPNGEAQRLVGITSHSYDSSSCDKGGVDTRIDVWREWIDAQILKNRCEGGHYSSCLALNSAMPIHGIWSQAFHYILGAVGWNGRK